MFICIIFKYVYWLYNSLSFYKELVLGYQVVQVTKKVKEMILCKCRVFCHCNCTDVVRNGKRNGVQRYLCRNCKNLYQIQVTLLFAEAKKL